MEKQDGNNDLNNIISILKSTVNGTSFSVSPSIVP